MTRADAFARRGVVIVEYALTADDLARMAVAFDGRCASTALWSWLERHETLAALAAELSGGSGVCRAIETATLESDCPTWFEGWHRERGAEGRTAVELTVYLDGCDETAGPVEVMIGSHRRQGAGRSDARETGLCVCAPGDILALHPAVMRRRQRPASRTAGRLLRFAYAAAAVRQRGNSMRLTPERLS